MNMRPFCKVLEIVHGCMNMLTACSTKSYTRANRSHAIHRIRTAPTTGRSRLADLNIYHILIRVATARDGGDHRTACRRIRHDLTRTRRYLCHASIERRLAW